MTHDICFVKARTNKQKQTDVLLYVNEGCGLNTHCYSIKCNKQQKSICVSRAKICTLDKIGIGPDLTGSVDRIGPDWTGLDHGSDHGSDHRK